MARTIQLTVLLLLVAGSSNAQEETELIKKKSETKQSAAGPGGSAQQPTGKAKPLVESRDPESDPADKTTHPAKNENSSNAESKPPHKTGNDPSNANSDGTDSKVPKTSSGESKKKQKEDAEFLKQLVPDVPFNDPNAKADRQDELDRAVAAMRKAGSNINKGDVSDETRNAQKDALKQIDELIKKLQNQPPPKKSDSNQKNQNQNQQQQSKNQNGGASQQRRSQNQQKRNQTKRAGQESQHQQQQSKSQAGQQKDKAAESQEQNDRRVREARNAMARRRALINEVWGHLPPAMREKLLNVGGEKLLPKYEEMIRRYYEALAEGDKARQTPPSTSRR